MRRRNDDLPGSRPPVLLFGASRLRNQPFDRLIPLITIDSICVIGLKLARQLGIMASRLTYATY